MAEVNDLPHDPSVAPLSSAADAAPKLDVDIQEKLRAEEDAHLGVKAAEASEKVYGRYVKWLLYTG